MIKKKILLAFAVFASSILFAQIGVGTINPRNAFHVDGGKNNNAVGSPTTVQQQDDVIITDAGQIGVGTSSPSTKLHINSTLSPALRIVDGTQGANKVLTSDINGNASWTASAATKPTVSGILPALSPNVVNDTWVYLNAYITLPPGNWLVQMGTALKKNDSTLNSSWINFTLSDNATSFAVTSDIDGTRSGSQIAIATASANDLLTFGGGVLAINNNTGTSKTYYLWSKKASGTATVIAPMSSSVFERYFYAIPVN